MPFDMPPLVNHTQAVEVQVQQCIKSAAIDYNVPYLLLRAIRHKESGTVGEVVKGNSNGSYDIGPMQINSLWLKEMPKYDIDKDQLLNDPCTNVYAGAWILKGYYDHHNDWFKATASYNAGFRVNRGLPYARDVFGRWSKYYKQTLVATAD